ncbi:MAG: proton-conducting membrane transporter, partial [Tissierellia bacterium]|nr:proton-conducting membrane transporter [Tissierellia bacterium]
MEAIKMKGRKDESRALNKIDFFTLNSIIVFSALLVLVVRFIFMDPYVESLNITNTLPLWIIIIPLVSGPIQVFIGKKSEILRDILGVNTSFIVFLSLLWMYPKVIQGTMVYELEGLLGLGLTFKVDMLSLIISLAAAILWVLVTMYSHDYMQVENHRNRFYLWMSITFSGILGTLMAGDLFTMYLFFEMMTFSSYFLVAHNQKPEAIIAGRSYIYMSIVGGLSILFGMFLLYNHTGTLEFTPLIYEIQALGSTKYLIASLLIGG